MKKTKWGYVCMYELFVWRCRDLIIDPQIGYIYMLGDPNK